MSFAIIDFNNSKWKWRTKIEYYPDKIDIFLPKFKKNKSLKYSKKVVDILKRNKINNVVLNNNLLNDSIFCDELVNAKKHIITGKNMYEVLILRVLKDLSYQMKHEIHKLKIALLINDYSSENIDLIKTIAKEVKLLTVVTTYKDKFDIIKKELFENEGIILKIVEKNITNLENENVIINVDFSSYDMNKIKVNNNALIICGFASKYEIKKNFDGIIIRKIEVIDPENMNPNIDDLSLCEAKIYSYLRKIKQNDREFDRERFKVNGYYGENGKLLAQDFEKFGQKII